MLLVLSVSMLTLAFSIEAVKASGTIYIKADGSVDPEGTPILRDGDLYTFTNDIFDEIIVEKDNIVIDGAGYTVQGKGSGIGGSNGINMSYRNNVTLKNVEVTNSIHGIRLYFSGNNTLANITASNNFIGINLDHSKNNTLTDNNASNNEGGIFLVESSSNNNITGNNASNNVEGILVRSSSNNNITGNNAANSAEGILIKNSSNNLLAGNNFSSNEGYGIRLDHSNNNTLTSNNVSYTGKVIGIGIRFEYSNSNLLAGNILFSNWQDGINLLVSMNNTLVDNIALKNEVSGIVLILSGNNTLAGNTALNNEYGILIVSTSILPFPNNTLFHNNLIDNTVQASSAGGYPNRWDDGYISGGNYWSDYTGTDTDGDGIGDVPYIIDADNEDRYPLMEPWPLSVPAMIKSLTRTVVFWNLPKGTEKSLMGKLDASLHLLDKVNENGAFHKLMDFINLVEAQKGKKLTNEQAEQLISEAQKIISLIQE